MKNLKHGFIIAALCSIALNPLNAQQTEPLADEARIGYDVKPDNPDTNPVSLREIEPTQVKLFPNPCSEKLNLEFPFESHRQLQIFSLSGELVQNLISKTELVEVSLTTLPPGPYVLKVGEEVYKFVKQ